MRLKSFIVLLAFSEAIFAQNPLMIQGRLQAENQYFEEGKQYFSKSYLLRPNSILDFESDSLYTNEIKPKGFSLAQTQRKNQWHLLPLFNASYGVEDQNRNFHQLQGGFQVHYSNQKKWSVWTNLLAVNHKFDEFTQSYLIGKRALPYFGNVKVDNQQIQGFNVTGAATFRASDQFLFEVGNASNFIGDGYRSQLLSDYAGPNPYAKITTSFWKIRYHNIYSRLSSPNQNFATGAPGNPIAPSGSFAWNNFSGWSPKYTTTHFLETKLGKRWSFGVFETIVWDASDSLIERGFDPNYLNPVIFYRPVEYSIGSSDNVLIGAIMKFQMNENISIYGQLLIDEFLLSALRADVKQFFNKSDTTLQSGWWANKHSGQIGIKFHNFLNIENLLFLTEANYSRPYNYTHVNNDLSYTHQGFSLAHPMGANYRELLMLFAYNSNSWQMQGVFSMCNVGLDYNQANFGSDLLLPYTSRNSEYGNELGQGVSTNVYSLVFDFSKEIHRNLNLSVFGRLHYNAWLNNLEENKLLGIQIGLRTFMFTPDSFFKLNN